MLWEIAVSADWRLTAVALAVVAFVVAVALIRNAWVRWPGGLPGGPGGLWEAVASAVVGVDRRKAHWRWPRAAMARILPFSIAQGRG